MSCALCTVRARRREPTFYLFPATADMGSLLTDVLADHHIEFEPQGNLLALPGVPDQGRVVALLRQILSDPERRAVSVFESDGREFPQARTLDDWWRAFETRWFGTALAEDRFKTWFQPIVDTSRRRVFAHECLIRLQDGRTHNGAEIVEAAVIRNETHAFDKYARRLAIRSAAEQSPQGRYFVNFMASSIYNPDYCMKSTMQALVESGMTSTNIVFEVVEPGLVDDRAHLRRICDYCRREGFDLAIDNMGANANVVPVLNDLRPGYMKLDKSLIQNVEEPTSAATIRKLVELADQYSAVVIAEGVEKIQTMENLWLLGVECMQGFLFGRPSPQIVSRENDIVTLAQTLEPKTEDVVQLLQCR